MQVRSLGREDPLEEGMATHSSIAWRIPWSGNLAGYSQRFTYNWTQLKRLTCARTHTRTHGHA